MERRPDLSPIARVGGNDDLYLITLDESLQSCVYAVQRHRPDALWGECLLWWQFTYAHALNSCEATMRIAFSQRLAAALALTTLVAVTAACGNSSPSPTSTPSNRADGLSFVQVGRGEMSDSVVAGLFAQGAEVDRVEDISEIEAAEETAILFDGAWFEERGDSPGIYQFLETAVQSGTPVVMIGGKTSKLYDALDTVGVITLLIGEDGKKRNPAYYDPPQAGFKLDDEPTEAGRSHLASHSTDPEGLVDALLQWI